MAVEGGGGGDGGPGEGAAGGGCDGRRGGDVGEVAPRRGTPPGDKYTTSCELLPIT